MWDKLSPHISIDDEWYFRYQFYKYLPFKLHFITGFFEGEAIGVLPLQMNTGEGLSPPYADKTQPFLEFFGGDDTDDNRVLMRPDYIHLEKQFLDNVGQFAYLAGLQKKYVYQNEESDFYENKYILSVEGLSSYGDYIEKRWEGSSRKKLRQQVRKLERENKIEVVKNDFSDIEYLAQLNKKRFGGDSSFQHEYRLKVFKDLAQIYQAEIITLYVNGQKMGVSYGIKYKDAFLGMNTGVDGSLSDLGKLLVLQQIQRAIELGCRVYDAGKGSGGWKTEFKFQPVPQYISRINPEYGEERESYTAPKISFARS